MIVHHGIAGIGQIRSPLHLAIGVFDGVHLGHQAVIGAALDSAECDPGAVACVVTFDPHPARILAPASAPRLLTSTRHKLNLLSGMGIGHVAVLPFDREFADWPAEEFVFRLCQNASGLRRICVGADWRFGSRCQGDVSSLEAMGRKMGFSVTGVPTVRVDGMVASSTRIREAVAGGDFAVARKLLGRPYTVLGTVVHGRQLGREMGFPTANLRVHNEQLPPTGVYAVKITRDGGEWNGVGNLGYRPSIESEEARRRLEVHLFDWEGDLYDEDIEVQFLGFLRPEKKFENLDELRSQIAKDAIEAREWIGRQTGNGS